jgi:hypothetical protein
VLDRASYVAHISRYLLHTTSVWFAGPLTRVYRILLMAAHSRAWARLRLLFDWRFSNVLSTTDNRLLLLLLLRWIRLAKVRIFHVHSLQLLLTRVNSTTNPSVRRLLTIIFDRSKLDDGEIAGGGLQSKWAIGRRIHRARSSKFIYALVSSSQEELHSLFVRDWPIVGWQIVTSSTD